MFGSGWRCTNHFVPFKKNSLLAAHKGVRKGILIDDSVSSIQIGLTSVFWVFFFLEFDLDLQILMTSAFFLDTIFKTDFGFV